MGRQLVNDLGKDSRNRGLQSDAYYLTFLKEALTGKQPGLGNLIFTEAQPSQQVLDTFSTPTGDHQDYTVVVIDAKAFENGGTLTVDIEVGRGEGDGTFYLLNGDKKLSRKEGIFKDDILAWAWSASGETGQITHRFDQGQLFKLGVTGYSDEEAACVNAFLAKISVEVDQRENTTE